ncbi:uncharacterized protein LOC135586098 isoform X1 [Musa acuminata AAA Group]|uniref:uncharacterized protein LOC135586098 isoform X1 n=1 Tax=Musa acuminata AAA Group TaxID=214697 RepID=UPI0031DDCD0D
MEKAHSISLQTRSLLEKEFWRRPMRFTCKLLAVARKNGLVGCITCLEKGNACLRSISFGDAAQNLSMFSCTTWNICSAGKILCTSVDRRKNYALFGGKGVELNLWDLENCSKIWTAKPPPSNSLGIFYPTWFTTATFLSEDIEKLWLGRTIIRIVFMILQHKGDL